MDHSLASHGKSNDTKHETNLMEGLWRFSAVTSSPKGGMAKKGHSSDGQEFNEYSPKHESGRHVHDRLGTRKTKR